MSKINIFNYEGYYLELIEGSISIENKALLLDFLSKNPNLVEPEFEYALPQVDFDTTQEFKESLKIHDESEIISEHNVEWFIWAKMEGILSNHSVVRLRRYLDEQPALYRLVVDFQETILPTERFIFPNKRSLKHGKKFAVWPIISTAAAAVLAIILLTNMNGQNNLNQEFSEDARTESSPVKDETKTLLTNIVNSLKESNETPTASFTGIQSSPEKQNEEKVRVKPSIKVESFEKESDNLAVLSESELDKGSVQEIEEVQPKEIEESVITEENPSDKNEFSLAEEKAETPAPVETQSLTPTKSDKRKFKLRIGRFGISKK